MKDHLLSVVCCNMNSIVTSMWSLILNAVIDETVFVKYCLSLNSTFICQRNYIKRTCPVVKVFHLPY